MPKKKIKKSSPFTPDAPLRVKKSYYTFSKHYPAGNLTIKNMRSRNSRSHKVSIAAKAVGVVLLVVLSFFTVSLALDISYKKPDTSVSQSQKAEKPFIKTEGIKALYMPYGKLGDEKYVRKFASKIKRRNATSVIIDFKTSQGKLAYTSLDKYAIKGKCALFDNDTVRKAINIFEQNDIRVIAGVYCFEDSAVAQAVKGISVKYMDTEVNWLDSDGNGWLNPCSKRTWRYITNIMLELNKMGIKGFVLNSAGFPDSANDSAAAYPGLKAYKSKDEVISGFMTQVKKSLPKDCFVIMGMSAENCISKKGAQMSSSRADGFAVNTFERPEKYIIDKKTDFTSILSLYSDIQHNAAKKAFVPIIDMREYSGSYLRHMKKAGYENFILYNENGDY